MALRFPFSSAVLLLTMVDWAFVADVFADALEVRHAERDAWIAERCRGRPEDQAAVERMLEARARADPDFLTGVNPEVLEEIGADLAAPISTVGPWRLLDEIGRGGMGQVFLAERADGQFEQTVAIKLLKRGMDSDAILARFLRERRILAALDHPNIARLLDGGIATDGRPYFVMEYVDGRPLTEYADAERLTVDERLRLFESVCSAVEYAHRNLIVHRDLKPSNILATRDGRVKLLDFGIARLLTNDPAGIDTLTADGVRVLTPAFAAPEQFHGGAITTSTDVYGLGAVLYLLLSGRAPFVGTGDRHVRAAHMEPPSLTSALSRTTADDSPLPLVASVRATDAQRLRRLLAGDLEMIVAHAMHAAPDRRYASVGELREDLRRHQERVPVRARGHSVFYRVSRFVRRNRVGVAVAAAFFVIVVSFAVIATMQAKAITLERDRAQAVAAGLNLVEMANFARVRGEPGEAVVLATRGVDTLVAQLGVEHQMVAAAYMTLADMLEAVDRLDESIEVRRRAVRGFAADGNGSALVPSATRGLAASLAAAGRTTEALATYEEAVAAYEANFDPDYTLTAGTLIEYGRLLLEVGRSEEAERHIRDGVERMERAWGVTDPRLDRFRVTLGVALVENGRRAEAERVLSDVYRRLRAEFGERAPETLRAGAALDRLRSSAAR